jgi:hypothetical protein
MFYPGSDHFLIPDPTCKVAKLLFLASYAFKSKVFVLVKVIKIRDPEKFIPVKITTYPLPDEELRHYSLNFTSIYCTMIYCSDLHHLYF